VPSQLNNLPLIGRAWVTFCLLGGTNHFACPLPALPNVCTSGSRFPPECNYLGVQTSGGGTALDLSSRGLTGSIPAELADLRRQLPGLRTLDLRDNQLAYPRTSEARVEYDLATRIDSTLSQELPHALARVMAHATLNNDRLASRKCDRPRS